MKVRHFILWLEIFLCLETTSETLLFQSERNLRSTWLAAESTFTGLLTAEPAAIEICRGMVRAEPVLIAPAHPAEYVYPFISFYTIICLDVEWFLRMNYLEHLYRQLKS